jgi:hypothetical protein
VNVEYILATVQFGVYQGETSICTLSRQNKVSCKQSETKRNYICIGVTCTTKSCTYIMYNCSLVSNTIVHTKGEDPDTKTLVSPLKCSSLGTK